MALAKLGILISGGGSNMKSIVAACEAGDVPAEVAIVISNRADAPGLEWAIEHGLTTALLPHTDYSGREAHDRAVVERLREAEVEWVCLAGYMRLLSALFVDAFRDRILNIHPALLPSFPGLHGQQQAWEYGVKVSGCTVHFVDRELDHGPIVVQRTVAVLPDDDGERSPEDPRAGAHRLSGSAAPVAERTLEGRRPARGHGLNLTLSSNYIGIIPV